MEGKIKWEISSLSTLTKEGQKSPVQKIADLPWLLDARTECSERTGNEEFFSIYIYCNQDSESTLWSCEAEVLFRLISQKENIPDVSKRTPVSTFNKQTSTNWGVTRFLKWDDIINSEKGYMKNDGVIVEALIKVKKTSGVGSSPNTFNFSTPNSHSDGILLVGCTRLHVSKVYLALYSPYFSSLFSSDFRDSSQKEISIEDVDLNEFIGLLQVVYPSHKRVTSESVEFLLKLGDRFQIQYVMDKCVKFLMKTEEIPKIRKLVLADRYRLASVQDACIRSYTDIEEIEKLKTAEKYQYGTLSDTSKFAVVERMLKLTK